MLGDSQPIATVPVRDAGKARDFYERTLGLKPTEERPGVITYRGGGSNVLVYESQYAGSNEATAVTWASRDVKADVDDLKAKGVRFEHYDNMPGLKLEGDVYVGGDMKVAWFKDPDGNIHSIVGSA